MAGTLSQGSRLGSLERQYDNRTALCCENKIPQQSNLCILDGLMQTEGPVLEILLRRLAETPQDFLAEPYIAGKGTVRVAAVVGDLLQMLGERAEPSTLKIFQCEDVRRDLNRLSVVLVLCWLLSEDWFRQATLPKEKLLRLLTEEAELLAGQVASNKFITDHDRREELARQALSVLGYRPAGETLAQSQDRLVSLSSTERKRVMQAARVAEERARAVREALARKAAQESADKWTRE
jgi:hypothetical protein